MTPQVLVRLFGGKEFFVVDEDTTAKEIIDALKNSRKGFVRLYHLKHLLVEENILLKPEKPKVEDSNIEDHVQTC